MNQVNQSRSVFSSRRRIRKSVPNRNNQKPANQPSQSVRPVSGAKVNAPVKDKVSFNKFEDKILGNIYPTTNSNRPVQPANRNNGPRNFAKKQNSNYQPGPRQLPVVQRQPQGNKPVNLSDPNALRIIPIGGCEEVGRNMTVFEYKDDIVVLDMGIQFPEEDMPGIDYIIPNIDYLKGKEKKIRGVIFSHGHLDHIGAAPILLEKLGNPTIIGRDLTIAMVKHRVEDYQKDSSKKLKIITIKNVNEKMKLGAFEISFFQIEHSIMDAVGVVIKTPNGTVIHPGDWTMDKDRNGKSLVDYSHLAKLPSPKILMLESLGAVDVRKSSSSEEMKKNLTKLITEAKGRIIIGTFSSQIERISWIISIAQQFGKKVALDGYSMKMNVEISQKLGYIKAAKGTLIKIEQVNDFPDNRVIVLCTGAQAESNAVLSRIIDGSHKSVKLRKSDTIVLSSSIIPGNERTIQRLKDNLYRQCDNVIHGDIMDIHVSGHGNREDIVSILRSVRPDYYIPVYANHYMLKEAAKLALSIGMKADRIIVPDNGTMIEFNKNGAKILAKKAITDYVFVDGLGITDSHNIILRDRQMMAADGMLVIIATVDGKTGELIHNPDLISRGFVYMKENKKLIEMTRQKAKKILKDNNLKTAPDEPMLREKIRNEIGKFLFQKTEKRPMILPVIIEV